MYQYTKTPGPLMPFLEDHPATDHCYLFLDAEVWTLLVRETNPYASQARAHIPSGRSWNNVDILEMNVFFGMLILMGVLHLPRLEMYWQTKYPLLRLACMPTGSHV